MRKDTCVRLFISELVINSAALCVCEAGKMGGKQLSSWLRGNLVVLDRKSALGSPSSCWESKEEAKNVTAGVGGQRCPQDPHLQLHPALVQAGVKVGSQPRANVY